MKNYFKTSDERRQKQRRRNVRERKKILFTTGVYMNIIFLYFFLSAVARGLDVLMMLQCFTQVYWEFNKMIVMHLIKILSVRFVQ